MRPKSWIELGRLDAYILLDRVEYQLWEDDPNNGACRILRHAKLHIMRYHFNSTSRPWSSAVPLMGVSL